MSQGVVLILFQVLVLVFAFCVHESAHAWTAKRLGDPTAYMLGRVTLNPLKHLDPFGSVLMPLIGLYYGGFIIGWAKPCPVTLRNFKNIRRDDILTSLAGPASNLAMAIGALLLLVIFKHAVPGGRSSIGAAIYMAEASGGFDTSGLGALFPIALLLYFGVIINLMLFVFNLFPIPPLDGSHVLRNFLPASLDNAYARVGPWALLLFFFFGGRLMGVFYYPLIGSFAHLLAIL